MQKVSSFLNDLQKPLDVFILVFFLVRRPIHRLKMSQCHEMPQTVTSPPRVSKIVRLRHLRPKLLDRNSASLNPPAKNTQKSHHRLKNHLKNYVETPCYEKKNSLDGGQKSEVAPGFKNKKK